MRILVTGNMGYVGPVLVHHLRTRFPQSEIIGFDSGFFAHCLTAADSLPETILDKQIFGDVRATPADLMWDVDAVVHLAAVSNDPMGKQFETATDAINYQASLRMAELAKANGVKHFVFASSCSVYGFAAGGPRKETDTLDPLTAYARSKIATEESLRAMQSDEMTITCLRFATACGMSPRLRLDLVINDFVAAATANGEISVLSDGTPWRPLIDVADMARAIEWAITRSAFNGGAFLTINAGSDAWNYQVRDLADAVAAALPGTEVSVNANAPPDKRSYKVDFGLYRSLAPEHQPQMNLTQSVANLRNGLQAINFADRDFRQSSFIRLRMLEAHMNAGRLDSDLRWQREGIAVVGQAAA